jgi:Uncharacterised nucleotidyltransferase
MNEAIVLVNALRDPASVQVLDAKGWTALLTIARAEQLIGTLAQRLQDQPVPDAVAPILADARTNAAYQRSTALWEADCARRALASYQGKVVMMKGTAYVAAGLNAGVGRHIGDLDIMVARADLREVEELLLREGGWEWVKEDAYDDTYYRDHMHELPPMIHKERDRMIDVHHTILPLTARPRPDAAALLKDALELENGLYIFSPTDMAIHCAAHLLADGDMSGGLRNLWDFHCLLTEFAAADPDYYPVLKSRAQHHQLWKAVHRAARLAHILYGTEIPKEWRSWNRKDNWFIRRLLVRTGWGTQAYPFTRLAFYIRSHWLRMPPLMLARHLWTKWRK